MVIQYNNHHAICALAEPAQQTFNAQNGRRLVLGLIQQFGSVAEKIQRLRVSYSRQIIYGLIVHN
jgi:hypothetical protein